jgi:hypothetical protein
MSAGNAGNNGTSPPEGDDPFGYLYRQEGAAPGAPPPAPPQQPSYRQVRPVGERTYAGQQGQPPAYGYPQQAQQQNAYYAAPETQPGGNGYRGGPGPGGYDDEEPPRRNTMLIGAIAVVTAVVLGVGAAILFSGKDEEKDPDDDQSQVDPGPSDGTTDGGGDEPDPGGDTAGDDGDDDEDDPDEPEFEAPVADLASLTPVGGAFLNGGDIANARSDDGSYIDGLNAKNSTIAWQFDYEGEPGSYRLFIGYSVPPDDQLMSLAINTQVREDPIDFKYWGGEERERENSWFHTYKDITLVEGENTVYLGCATGKKCDVFIDKLEIVEVDARPEWAPAS